MHEVETPLCPEYGVLFAFLKRWLRVDDPFRVSSFSAVRVECPGCGQGVLVDGSDATVHCSGCGRVSVMRDPQGRGSAVAMVGLATVICLLLMTIPSLRCVMG